MSYSDLLRDPRWQRKRLEVMERADFTCEDCGDTTTTLNVHHTFYAKGRKPWEYELDTLKCLCESCHERVTEHLASLQRMFGKLDDDDRGRVLGYARGLAAQSLWPAGYVGEEGPVAIRIKMETDAILFGTADALKLGYEELYDAMRDDSTIGWPEILAIYERRKQKLAATKGLPGE